MSSETLTNQHEDAFVCTSAFDWLLIKCLRPAPSVLGHLDPGDAMAVVPPSSALQGGKLPPAKCWWILDVASNLSAPPATLAGHHRHPDAPCYSEKSSRRLKYRVFRIEFEGWMTECSFPVWLSRGLLVAVVPIVVSDKCFVQSA